MNNTKLTSEISTPDGRTTEFKTYANYLRARIADLGRLVQCFKKHPGVTQPDLRFCKVESDRGEMAANIVLSFRHLEDASMRLGKAIQAYDGGVSCYDEEKAKAAAKALEELRTSFKADMGHGQEIPKGPDAIIGDKCIDLKCSEPWLRDLSGNQITEGAFTWLFNLSRALGYELTHRKAEGGRITYHFTSRAGVKVASYGEIKSVFSFLYDQARLQAFDKGPADAISWPAGESSARPFVQPPQPFATVGTFEEAEKARNDKFRADVACRAYTAKPFTDESHSA